MAVTVYPLNNIDYDAEHVAIYNATRTSGIYAGDDFALSLTGSDNTISVDVGLAWMHLSRFFGVALALKGKTYVDMGIPDSVYSRIDALVLQFDANKNGAEIVVKKGSASGTPQPPALSRTEALYELHLAHVRRKPGAASITYADVTDMRMNSTYCGLMADAVSKVDTSAIDAQISALIKKLRDDLKNVEDGTYYASKEYVDNLKADLFTKTLYASGWSGSGPYTQTISADVTKNDTPHVCLVPSDNAVTAESQEEAWSMITRGVAYDGQIVFTCKDEKPTVDITLQFEVNH